MMFLWIGGGAPGWPELIVVVLVILLLFGAKRLPELARSLGKSITEFKRGRQEDTLSEGDAESSSDEKKDGENASTST